MPFPAVRRQLGAAFSPHAVRVVVQSCIPRSRAVPFPQAAQTCIRRLPVRLIFESRVLHGAMPAAPVRRELEPPPSVHLIVESCISESPTHHRPSAWSWMRHLVARPVGTRAPGVASRSPAHPLSSLHAAMGPTPSHPVVSTSEATVARRQPGLTPTPEARLDVVVVNGLSRAAAVQTLAARRASSPQTCLNLASFMPAAG